MDDATKQNPPQVTLPPAPSHPTDNGVTSPNTKVPMRGLEQHHFGVRIREPKF